MCFPLPGALPILLMDVWVISTVFGFCRRSRCERPSAGFEMNVCFRFSWGRCLGMGWVARLEHDGLWKKLPNGAHPRMSAEQRPLAAWDATPLRRRPLVSARCDRLPLDHIPWLSVRFSYSPIAMVMDQLLALLSAQYSPQQTASAPWGPGSVLVITGSQGLAPSRHCACACRVTA